MTDIDFLKIDKLPKEYKKSNIHLTIPKEYSAKGKKSDEVVVAREKDMKRAEEIIKERMKAFGFSAFRFEWETPENWSFMISP